MRTMTSKDHLTTLDDTLVSFVWDCERVLRMVAGHRTVVHDNLQADLHYCSKREQEKNKKVKEARNLMATLFNEQAATCKYEAKKRPRKLEEKKITKSEAPKRALLKPTKPPPIKPPPIGTIKRKRI